MSPLENTVRLFDEVLRDNGILSGRLGYEEDSVSVGFKALIDSALGGFEFADVAYDTMRQAWSSRRRRSATSGFMCQGEWGSGSLTFVLVAEDGEEDAVH